MFYKAENRKYLDTLRMTDSELACVVAEEFCKSSEERRWLRRTTNFMPMTIDVVQPGGTTGMYLVRSYDFSIGGVGFFTGNYIHRDTRCRLGVTTVDGEALSIDGAIAHCSNVWGHVHFAGVMFDSPIEMSWFDNNAKKLHTVAERASSGVADPTTEESVARQVPPSRGEGESQDDPHDEEAIETPEASPIEQALAVIDELRDLISKEHGPDEIRTCIERIEPALIPIDDQSQVDGPAAR